MKLFLILFFFSLPSFSQTQSDEYKRRRAEAERQRKEWEKEQKEAVKRWREQMESDRQLLERYFKSDLFKKFDKDIDKVLKSFDPGAFQKFFDDDHFNMMIDKIDRTQGLGEGDYRWLETPKEKILILKMTMPDDAPFDIKIENNHIVVKGTIIEKKEQRTAQGTNFYETTRTINKTFPVPSDVDGDKAQFESKPGEVLIKLPKKNVADLYKREQKMNPLPPPSKKKPMKTPQNSPRKNGLRPIPKSDSDLTI